MRKSVRSSKIETLSSQQRWHFNVWCQYRLAAGNKPYCTLLFPWQTTNYRCRPQAIFHIYIYTAPTVEYQVLVYTCIVNETKKQTPWVSSDAIKNNTSTNLTYT